MQQSFFVTFCKWTLTVHPYLHWVFLERFLIAYQTVSLFSPNLYEHVRFNEIYTSGSVNRNYFISIVLLNRTGKFMFNNDTFWHMKDERLKWGSDDISSFQRIWDPFMDNIPQKLWNEVMLCICTQWNQFWLWCWIWLNIYFWLTPQGDDCRYLTWWWGLISGSNSDWSFLISAKFQTWNLSSPAASQGERSRV